MGRHRTFGQKIGIGFTVVVMFTVAVGVVSVVSLRDVVASKNQVINEETQLLVGAVELRAASEHRARWLLEYLVTEDADSFDKLAAGRVDFDQRLERLRQSVTLADQRRRLDAIDQSADRLSQTSDEVIAMRKAGATPDQLTEALRSRVTPVRTGLDTEIDAFGAAQRQQIETATGRSSRNASTTIWLLVALIGVLVAVAAGVAILMIRLLNRQISTSVSQVRGSSAALKAAATQQATGIREQATAMIEITTTVNELLATSRQIADGAQHVAQISEHTADAARRGDVTVEQAHESIGGVRTQIDLVVAHMLDLGEKSQQVGGVLEIVSELAEQTNILAINATIEAAGAGEAGARFAVVADEIRKLADRVAGSTKEIRKMVDEVRTSVNTTIMATETGSKSVDAGAKQFAEVSLAFRTIGDLVLTTTEAAREIELSTKQQSGGVEQVRIATANVAQAARQTEASSGETEQTASRLAAVSQDLLRLVHSDARA